MEAQRLAKVGSWERQIETDTIQWSDEMLRILGLPSSAPSNFLTFMSYIHPTDREKILEADQKVRSSIGPADMEYRVVRPDGDVRAQPTPSGDSQQCPSRQPVSRPQLSRPRAGTGMSDRYRGGRQASGRGDQEAKGDA